MVPMEGARWRRVPGRPRSSVPGETPFDNAGPHDSPLARVFGSLPFVLPL